MDLRLHPKQGKAFKSHATEILYGGAAGGGKSHLIRVAAIAWCIAIPGLQVYIFRRTFPELWKNHMEGPGGFPVLLAPWVAGRIARIAQSGPNKGISFANGSKIHLCHCQHEKNVFDYHGAEIHVLIIDELTQWTAAMYRYLRGRMRMGSLAIPEAYLGLFPRMLSGANPGGIGHNWVKAGWVDLAPALQISQMPRTEGGMRRQYIPALLEDNPTLLVNDPDYEQKLEGLGSAAFVRALRYGDWNIVAGGAFDDVWDEKRIVLPRFKLPHSWRLDRSHDWGSTHPFSVLWWGQADGTEVKLPSGKVFCPPRGTLVLAHEWYGCKPGAPNEGILMAAREVGNGIIEREKGLVTAKWFHSTPRAGPADNQIRDVRDEGTPTIEAEMVKAGVRWLESDKSPGSRRNGLELMRSRLKEACRERPEDAAMYVMEHCRSAISHWPVLPRDPKNPDDVDTHAEDHDYDAARYRVLATKPVAMEINLGFAH